MPVKDTKQNIKPLDNTQVWFDNMISNLRVHQLLLESDMMEAERKDVYHALISGDFMTTFNLARESSSMFFIQNLINSYLIELSDRKRTPERLAFDLSDSKILVWAEIKDDDSDTEDALILSAAKVNNDFSQYGFYISSTIVEKNDKIGIPSHYKEVTIRK